tara:strand:+ start:4733 stop:5038 length:306 start_codon:yes stop_codon:yes gene_type:complete
MWLKVSVAGDALVNPGPVSWRVLQHDQSPPMPLRSRQWRDMVLAHAKQPALPRAATEVRDRTRCQAYDRVAMQQRESHLGQVVRSRVLEPLLSVLTFIKVV